MVRKLTDKQEAYKNNRIMGMGRQDSYKAAYKAKRMNVNSITKETKKLDSHPLIAPDLLKNTEEATERAIVTKEMVLNGLLAEASADNEDSTSSSRVAAWKHLSDHTGGFDANKKKVELSGDKENPISVLIHEISGNTLGPSDD
tara:strand:- start:259 stop:690 length:432 start_codon:yes stop_codon:yes gene_type:complete